MYNIGCISDTKYASHITNDFKDNWTVWANAPGKHVVHQGPTLAADVLELCVNVGMPPSVFPVEAVWQHGMVDRHGQVLADIVQADVRATSVARGQSQEVLLYAPMTTHRKPGRSG